MATPPTPAPTHVIVDQLPEKPPPGSTLVWFKNGKVQPPTALYVERDDEFYIRTHNSVASLRLMARLRWADDTGDIKTLEYERTPVANRLQDLLSVSLGEGYLLAATVVLTNGAPIRGQCFVEIGLRRSGSGTPPSAQVIVSDYITNEAALAWPGGIIRQAVEGPGALTEYVSTAVGAGAEQGQQAPARTRWRVRAVRFTLTTAAAVANRRVHLQLVDVTPNIILDLAANDAQAASLVRNYNCSPEGFQRAAQDSEIYIPIPDMFLSQLWAINTATLNLQGADQYSQMRVEVEEWIEP